MSHRTSYVYPIHYAMDEEKDIGDLYVCLIGNDKDLAADTPNLEWKYSPDGRGNYFHAMRRLTPSQLPYLILPEQYGTGPWYYSIDKENRGDDFWARISVRSGELIYFYIKADYLGRIVANVQYYRMGEFNRKVGRPPKYFCKGTSQSFSSDPKKVTFTTFEAAHEWVQKEVAKRRAEALAYEIRVFREDIEHFRPGGSGGSFRYSKGELNNFESFSSYGHASNLYNAGCGAAYLNMIENMPQSTTNQIENIVPLLKDIIDLGTAVKKGNVMSLIDACKKSMFDPKDIWLKYRYVYTTTKSDLEEFCALTQRISALNELACKEITLHGTYVYNGITFRCCGDFEMSSLLPSDFLAKLRQYGVRISVANMWDIIPFSFMIDWFTHIGDFLHEAEARQDALVYEPRNVWYSFETSNDNEVCYGRFRQREPLLRYAQWKFFEGPKNNRTWLMRATDTLAIFGK